MSIEKGIGKATANPFQKDGLVLVSKVASSGNLKEDVLLSVNLVGGFDKIIEKGDEVLLMPNCNSADAPPASSDPEFLKVLVETLFEHGAGKVVVGESSMQTTSTRRR